MISTRCVRLAAGREVHANEAKMHACRVGERAAYVHCLFKLPVTYSPPYLFVVTHSLVPIAPMSTRSTASWSINRPYCQLNW